MADTARRAFIAAVVVGGVVVFALALWKMRVLIALVDPALEATLTAFEVLVGIFFVLAFAAYWIYERERAITLVTSLLPRARRKVVRDTWNLIDEKLGAYVRG